MILQKIKRLHAFGDDIKIGEITMDKVNDEQNKLTQKIKETYQNQKITKPKNPKMIKEKSDLINSAMALLKGREIVYNGLESGIFPLPNQSIALAEQEKPSTSRKSSISEHSSDFFEYNSPEEKSSGRGLKVLAPKQCFKH